MKRDFWIPATVVVQCEEGEVSLSEEFLRKYSMTLVTVEEPEDLNEDLWKGIEDNYSRLRC